MKIVINALSALRGGGQTYLINLLRELKKLDYECSVVVISNSNNINIFEEFQSENVEIVNSSFASRNIIFRVLWEVFYLPFFLSKVHAKSYYAPGGVMVTLMPSGCKSYTALRNMLPFDERERKRFPLFSYIRFKLWILKHVFLVSYRMSDHVIFISNYSKEVVKSYYLGVEEKSKTIYHGINEHFLKSEQESTELPFGLIVGEYYLYVSILDVYKAQKEVVQSWIEMSAAGNTKPLILVGPKYNEYGEEVIHMINADSSNTIRYVGPVEYDKLPTLYHSARGLVFASSCECCPNIMLEKLASGRPVISSNIMPMPEFGKESVIYFDPYKEGSLKKAVETLESADNLNRYSSLSSSRASDFGWKQTASDTFLFLMEKNSAKENEHV
ncbi:glycosyltransferase family 1 protein [uncultured Vibrio sp.]|uniref:glycosyltransferase family 4 protein n=1 Tax=uncultured Vibrio sp. TaxID=114054 RepID=UPI00091B6172|nr:glycosyltransferase family 1 protein [uncultured Vibrio sp.]OIQ25317.1 MAG: hypothetical protein BM561_05995 [Vibrio sp. MedPE-SWchi]